MTIARPLPVTRDDPLIERRRTSLHGTIIAPRPIRGTVGELKFWANSWALPLADASCASVTCLDVLEFVRDDEAMIGEIARILRPGGRLRLRVPNSGPLAGLDSLNLYRYLVDVTRRGQQPPETDEIGWRRHYSVADLAALLEPSLCIRAVSTRRVGFAEIVAFAALLVFRWLRRSEARYQRVRSVVRQIERVEDTIRLRQAGSVLAIDAVRQPEPRQPSLNF